MTRSNLIDRFGSLRRALAGLAILTAAAALPMPASAQDSRQAELGPKFRDWQITCEAEGGARVCGAVQQIQNEDRLAFWAAFGKFQAGNQGTVLLLRLPYSITNPPSGFRVAAGLTLKVDGRDVATLPIESCGPGICQTGMLLNDQAVQAMKAGQNLQAGFQLANGSQATVDISLSGFTAAFDHLAKN